MARHKSDRKQRVLRRGLSGATLLSIAATPILFMPSASFASTGCVDIVSPGGTPIAGAEALLLADGICQLAFLANAQVEIPAGVDKVSVFLVGGGGGSNRNGDSTAGYAGGGGQWVSKNEFDVTAERTLDLVVGAAGNRLALVGDGGDTSLTPVGGSTLTAKGGKAGSSTPGVSSYQAVLNNFDPALVTNSVASSSNVVGAGTDGAPSGTSGGPGLGVTELSTNGATYLDPILWAEDAAYFESASISLFDLEFGTGGSIVSPTVDAAAGTGRGGDVNGTTQVSKAGSGSVIMRFQLPAVVTFLSNGAAGTMAPQSAISSTPISSNTFTRDGFTFAGWATNPDGTGTAYADGDSYGFSASDTLYAQWTPVSSLLTCDINQASLDFDRAFDFAAGAEINQTDGNGSSSLNIGANAVDDDSVHFFDLVTGCSTQIDARVTVTETVNVQSSAVSDRVDAIDDAQSTPGWNRYLATDGESDLAGDSYLGLRVEFLTGLTYAANSGTQVALANVVMSTYDLDWYQYLDANNFDRYSLSTDTHLTVSAVDGGLTRFASLTGNGTSSGVEAETIGRATLEFDSVDSISFRLGQDDPSADQVASYYLDFSTGESWAGVQAAAAAPPSVSIAPYTGPLLQDFSSRTLDVCTPKSITITGIRLLGATASVQGKPVTVLENTATKLVLAFPAGLTPGQDVDLVINSSSGTLTHQDAFDIPADTCAAVLSKGRWTQLQSDGKTVKMYAKDPIGDGKIQFFVDGEEIAWVNAIDEADPKLSFASSYPYLVRSVALHEGKNRFEIKLDGVRVWRATYVPKG